MDELASLIPECELPGARQGRAGYYRVEIRYGDGRGTRVLNLRHADLASYRRFLVAVALRGERPRFALCEGQHSTARAAWLDYLASAARHGEEWLDSQAAEGAAT